MTLVSVVVPVYNGMPYLQALTESILAQTHTDLDIVFSEGGGSDGSAAYLASLDDPRIRVITMPPGTGAAGNWTAASQAAQADFIKLVCQDDLLHPTAIATQLRDLESNPSAVMAIAQRDIVDAHGNVITAARGATGLRPGLNEGGDAVHACYVRGTNVLGEPVAVLFRRQALLAAMPWDDSNPLVLDLACYEKVASRGDVFVRKASLGAFRVSASSWSTRLARLQVTQYEQWQQQYADRHHPSAADRTRARLGLHTQATLRRAAYQWLRIKGSLTTDG